MNFIFIPLLFWGGGVKVFKCPWIKSKLFHNRHTYVLKPVKITPAKTYVGKVGGFCCWFLVVLWIFFLLILYYYYFLLLRLLMLENVCFLCGVFFVVVGLLMLLVFSWGVIIISNHTYRMSWKQIWHRVRIHLSLFDKRQMWLCDWNVQERLLPWIRRTKLSET